MHNITILYMHLILLSHKSVFLNRFNLEEKNLKYLYQGKFLINIKYNSNFQ